MKLVLFVHLQGSLDTLEKKNSSLELELIKAQRENSDVNEKFREMEEKCSDLQQNVRRYSINYCCIFTELNSFETKFQLKLKEYMVKCFFHCAVLGD